MIFPEESTVTPAGLVKSGLAKSCGGLGKTDSSIAIEPTIAPVELNLVTLFAKAAPPTYALPALSIATWPLATGLALLKLEKLSVEGLYLMTPAPAKVEMIKLP